MLWKTLSWYTYAISEIEIDTKNPKYVKVVWGIGYKMEKYDQIFA